MKTRVYFKITLLVGLMFCFMPKTKNQIQNPATLQPTINPSEIEPPTVFPPSENLPAQSNKKIDKHKPVVETVDLPEEKIGIQGNWIKKKEWLKETIKVNEEIQKLVDAIQKAKRPYSEKTRIIDEELDAFYKEEGFQQGKLQEIFSGINKYLEKKKQKEIERAKAADEQGITGDLEIKINLIEKEIDKSKSELEQLRLDIQSISDLDKSVHDRNIKVDEEIKIARNLSEKADQLTDETWYIIDDKIARKNYYELKGNILETIKSIQNYLKVDLSNDFDTVLSNIRSQINKVKEEIKSLEEKELIIKNRAERVEKIKREELETLRAKKAAAEKEIKEEQAKRLAQQPWYKRFYNHIVNVIAKVYLYITSIFGSKESTPVLKTAAIQETTQTPAQPTEPLEQLPVKPTSQPITPKV